MASQSQRLRKNISPKQGPLKATLPVSLMQQSSSYSPTKNSSQNSPTKSPIHLSRTSDKNRIINRQSPEERLFTTYQNIEGNGGGNSGLYIRRTASLDALCLAPMRSGCSGGEDTSSYYERNMVDRATQTPDEWDDTKMQRKALTEQLEKKFIRQKLQRSNRNALHTSPVPADHSAIPIPRPPLTPRLRNSVEGLNQEIEKLVLKGLSTIEPEADFEKIPDGHRAPVAELLCVNPSGNGIQPRRTITSSSSGSSGSTSRSHSISPHVVGRPPSSSASISEWTYTNSRAEDSNGMSPDHLSRGGSGPKLGTSPHINTFLTREPPDGCEKVKIVDEPSRDALPDSFGGVKPMLSSFILLPSQSSAFIPLPRVFHSSHP